MGVSWLASPGRGTHRLYRGSKAEAAYAHRETDEAQAILGGACPGIVSWLRTREPSLRPPAADRAQRRRTRPPPRVRGACNRRDSGPCAWQPSSKLPEGTRAMRLVPGPQPASERARLTRLKTQNTTSPAGTVSA